MPTRVELDQMHSALEDATSAVGELAAATDQVRKERSVRRIASAIARLEALLPDSEVVEQIVLACPKLERAILQSDVDDTEIFRIQIEQELAIMKHLLRGWRPS